MRFRIAVRAVEAWLIADAETLAAFLHVRRSFFPSNPDTLPNPKQSLVDLARRSSRSEIRKDMTPKVNSPGTTGPAYASRLIEYVSDHANGWRPGEAALTSESLRRCRASLVALTATAG